MSDNPINPHKAKALELAVQAGGEASAIVARATAFHLFLTGNAAATAPKAATPPAGAPKAATPPAGAPKAAAGSKAGTAPKAAAGSKAGASAAPKAAAAGSASAAAVPGDTKAPGGTYTYADVVNSLRTVQQAAGLGRERAFSILETAGAGAKSVRDLKPANYDGVVAACTAAVTPAEEDELGGDPPEHTGGGIDAESDPTSGPATDELGLS